MKQILAFSVVAGALLHVGAAFAADATAPLGGQGMIYTVEVSQDLYLLDGTKNAHVDPTANEGTGVRVGFHAGQQYFPTSDELADPACTLQLSLGAKTYFDFWKNKRYPTLKLPKGAKIRLIEKAIWADVDPEQPGKAIVRSVTFSFNRMDDGLFFNGLALSRDGIKKSSDQAVGISCVGSDLRVETLSQAFGGAIQVIDAVPAKLVGLSQ